MLHPDTWSLALPSYLWAFAFGYLLGSIPFGLILTRRAGTADIRTIGSGNIGATNVLRTGRKGLAAATLLGDMLKGTVAVLVVEHFFGRELALCAALGAFLGHLFPVWLGFKGGKGVATYIGLLLGFKLWLALAAFCVIWAALAALSRYSSLAALTASAATPAHPVVEPRFAGGAAIPAALGAAVVHASRQHRAVAARHGRQDRKKLSGLNWRGSFCRYCRAHRRAVGVRDLVGKDFDEMICFTAAGMDAERVVEMRT